MDQSPNCPACHASVWEEFGVREYDAADLDKLSPRKRLMQSVLFEKWRPGEKRVKLMLEGCGRCGMMIYAPRPTDAEIAAKYAFLNSALEDATPSRGEVPARARQRADRLFSLVKPHLARPVSQLRVLDFGGGDGRLMRRFIELGATCHLVDYTNRPVPGATKIGDNQEALTDSHQYDLVICSHVVEHLASPVNVLSTLREHLAADGVMYVEVPLEVYQALPIKTDPVTHVNFFTPGSLSTLLVTSGFDVRSSRISNYPHPHGRWRLAIGAIARKAERPAAVVKGGTRELRSLLSPSFARKLTIKAIKLRDKVRFRA